MKPPSRVFVISRRTLLLAATTATAGAARAAEPPVFVCPDCGKTRLRIAVSLEFPADGSSDEIALQAIECVNCKLRGAAVYTESRRGEGESVDHLGYRMKPADAAALRKELEACPSRTDTRCRCPAHQKYGAVVDGDWAGLQRVKRSGAGFPMRLG